jgi:hypothetical protein
MHGIEDVGIGVARQFDEYAIVFGLGVLESVATESSVPMICHVLPDPVVHKLMP